VNRSLPDLKFDPARKWAALLVPVFALRPRRDFGIGDTSAMREAVDFCAEQGLTVLQVLPIHETVGDHSPYNAISSCALAPALLALSEEEVPGLTEAEIARAAPESWLARLRSGPVKYNSVQPLKLQVLLAAHRAFRERLGPETELGAELARYESENAAWLPAYTLYRLLIREYEGNPNWTEWRVEHQSLPAAEAWLQGSYDRARLEEMRRGLAYIQWVADRQWRGVRAHAAERGVRLMGEMSFGVGRCSADVWARPDLFDLDWNVGTRPISYFDTNRDSERWGQNWGLPPYRWENHRSEGFAWLRRRMEIERRYFDICRIDHLRGYFRAYMFPWPGGAVHSEFATLSEEEAKARTGGLLPRFVPGPDEDPTAAQMNDLQGRELIGVLREAAGGMELVAELMGMMPQYMERTLDDLAVANLTFPQLERGTDRALRAPETFRALSLASYGNHDHTPLALFYRVLVENAQKGDATALTDLRNLLAFIAWKEEPPAELDDALLLHFQRALLNTPCVIAGFLSSDLLGTAQRFNLPGSYGAGTWAERLELPLREYLTHALYGPRLAALKLEIAAAGRLPGGVTPAKESAVLTSVR